MEGADKIIEFSVEGKRAILNKVIEAEEWEKFLARKYVGTKRFGLDGGESMIPAMEAIIKYGGQYGVREIVYGMAHRGRLNMLANVMAKPYKVIFHEFAGGSANPDDVGGSGDVKYHLGTSTDREFGGASVHMSLVPESVAPGSRRSGGPRQGARAAGGARRSGQARAGAARADPRRRGVRGAGDRLGMPRLLGHPRLQHRRLHPFHRQQPDRLYDQPAVRALVALSVGRRKGVMAPILHVNGDDPEAVTFACKLAIDFRQQFKRDVVIDMWCYRRFGHNEGDEPSFTQPLMYAVIRQHPPVSQLCAAPNSKPKA